MAEFLSFIFRVVPGGIFLIAGLAKISDPARFLLTLRELELFPGSIDRLLAVYLPWLEFVLGLFLLLGILHRTSALLLALVNIFFIGAIISLRIRGIEIDCGCFGLLADILKLPDKADFRAVIRNLLFAGMCLYVFQAKNSLFSLEGYLRKRN
jgi:uncharacterized membrane protein YphA (DoxX/SURF4 family)